MAKRKRRETHMDPRIRGLMIGKCWHRTALPTLAQRDGEDTHDVNGHTVHNTSQEGEIHPVLCDSERTRARLGFDPIPAE